MKSFSHYLKDYGLKNLHDTTFYGNSNSNELPLLVNCAGLTIAEVAHTNSNNKGRLDYYLIYVLADKLQVFYQDEWRGLEPGSVIIIPPNTPYKCKCATASASFLWVHFTGSDVEKVLERYKIGLFPCIYKTAIVNNIYTRFQKLFEGFAKNDLYRTYDLAALLDRLLIEIGRAIEEKETNRVTLSRSIRYINENYTSQIKIPYLAQMENMCMTAYNMAFKKQMGMSPTRYIINLRIDSAKELLRTTNLKIREVATICGYDDVCFFRKTFKKEVGVSPLEYRKSFSLT
ncbi:MAG: helix-turn-helix transcriptional regulator [Clostridia bacterium]|nr:helix-turn-helix transcriptional regulator [Clostridia bacterium]